MIKYLYFDRNFDEIQKVADHYMPDLIKDELEAGIADSIEQIVLEFPYIDKDFRDTY